ncbi:MAG: hypothetical protein H7Y32_03490 [Chloroflexales bacterium]|nr:hypothetical protein [Chloroflexales bacterium]
MDVFVEWAAQLVALAALLFLIAGLLAPFETLGWWAGWSRRWPDPVSLPALPDPAPPTMGAEPTCYLVYLTGVGVTDADRLTPKEQNFLDMLAARLPQAALMRNIFPYSAVNNPLTGRRRLRRFWHWMGQAIRQPITKNLYHIVALRNVLQVAVSADRRYGPVFNFGVARGIVLSLLRRGYRVGSAAPVVLIGLSGSGQIAVGSGAVVRRLLSVPVWVVSVGGVLTSDPGILDIEHVFHLSGSRDHTQYVGMALYPGCWPIVRGSSWNRALAQGRRTVIAVGPMKHMSHGDYFSRSSTLPSGESHVERTVAVIAECVEQIGR